MLLRLGRIGLFAAVAMFVFAIPASVGAQADASTAEHEETAGKAEHGAGQAEHAHTDDDADHDDAGDHDAGSGAHAGDHGDPPGTPPLLQFDIGSAVCNIAIFLGVLAVLSKFVWPEILNGLKAREEKIHGDLAAAETARTEADKLKAEFQAQLDEAQSQVQTMLAQARKDSEANGQRIIDEAKAEAARQTERAVAEIETAKKVAISELAGQTSDMAIGVAKQIVGRELKPEDHQELIRQSLDRLPSNN